MAIFLIATVSSALLPAVVAYSRDSKLSALPINDLSVPRGAPFTHTHTALNEWDNGYDEDSYNRVLDTFYDVLRALGIEALGGKFIIERDWQDGSVNAFAWKGGDQYGIEIPGGMSRYELINEEAFILVICHGGGGGGGGPSSWRISSPSRGQLRRTVRLLRRTEVSARNIASIASDV